jgi:hypothetical protein
VTNFGTHHSSSFDRNEIVILIGKFLLTEGFPAIVHQGVLDEAANFLQKPFAPDPLAQKVREVLDQPAPSVVP